MKADTTLLILGLGGLAAVAYFATRDKGAVKGNASGFASTGTASPPGFWSLGAAPGGLVNIKSPSDAPAWASVASTSINALGRLAQQYYRPNTKVETVGGSRVDRTPYYSTLADYDAAKGRAYAEANELAYGGVDAYYNGPEVSDPDLPDFNEELI